MSDDTQQPLPLPQSGGSYIRRPDGSLVRNEPAPADGAGTDEAPGAAKPAKKGK